MLRSAIVKNRNMHVSLFAGLSIFLLPGFHLVSRSTENEAGSGSWLGQPEALELKNSFHNSQILSVVSKSDAWEFDVVRDGGCSAAFPKLYSNVDEMVSRRKDNSHSKSRHGLCRGEEHQTSAIKAMIHNRKLYIISDDGLAVYQSRSFATLHAMNRVNAGLTRPSSTLRTANSESTLAIWQVR